MIIEFSQFDLDDCMYLSNREKQSLLEFSEELLGIHRIDITIELLERLQLTNKAIYWLLIHTDGMAKERGFSEGYSKAKKRYQRIVR